MPKKAYAEALNVSERFDRFINAVFSSYYDCDYHAFCEDTGGLLWMANIVLDDDFIEFRLLKDFETKFVKHFEIDLKTFSMSIGIANKLTNKIEITLILSDNDLRKLFDQDRYYSRGLTK